jgi:hypothetical protein
MVQRRFYPTMCIGSVISGMSLHSLRISSAENCKREREGSLGLYVVYSESTDMDVCFFAKGKDILIMMNRTSPFYIKDLER